MEACRKEEQDVDTREKTNKHYSSAVIGVDPVHGLAVNVRRTFIPTAMWAWQKVGASPS